MPAVRAPQHFLASVCRLSWSAVLTVDSHNTACVAVPHPHVNTLEQTHSTHSTHSTHTRARAGAHAHTHTHSDGQRRGSAAFVEGGCLGVGGGFACHDLSACMMESWVVKAPDSLASGATRTAKEIEGFERAWHRAAPRTTLPRSSTLQDSCTMATHVVLKTKLWCNERSKEATQNTLIANRAATWYQ